MLREVSTESAVWQASEQAIAKQCWADEGLGWLEAGSGLERRTETWNLESVMAV